jgi:hypothetical protein
MLKQGFENTTAALLAKRDNVVLACEIYNESCGVPKGRGYPDDAVVELLGKPENSKMVGAICIEFPSALSWLAKSVLLKQIYDQCQKRLQPVPKWKLAAEQQNEADLFREPYPGFSLDPVGAPSRHWSFYFSMDARKVPITLEHGITYSDRGGQPKVMPKALKAAVLEVEAQFKNVGFNIKKGSDHSWFAHTDRPYKQYALGGDPPLLDAIFTGELGEEIAAEFAQFFLDSSPRIGQLNSLLRAGR